MTPRKVSKCITMLSEIRLLRFLWYIGFAAAAFLPVYIMALDVFTDDIMAFYVLSAVMGYLLSCVIFRKYPIFGVYSSDGGAADTLMSGSKNGCTAISVFPINRKTALTAFWNEFNFQLLVSCSSALFIGIWFTVKNTAACLFPCILSPVCVLLHYILTYIAAGAEKGRIKKFLTVCAGSLCVLAGAFAAGDFLNYSVSSRTAGIIIIVLSIVTSAVYFVCRCHSVGASEGITISYEKIKK